MLARVGISYIQARILCNQENNFTSQRGIYFSENVINSYYPLKASLEVYCVVAPSYAGITVKALQVKYRKSLNCICKADTKGTALL